MRYEYLVTLHGLSILEERFLVVVIEIMHHVAI